MRVYIEAMASKCVAYQWVEELHFGHRPVAEYDGLKSYCLFDCHCLLWMY